MDTKKLNRIISPDTQRSNRLPPGQILTARWPVLHHGSVPDVKKEKWAFRLHGLVENERTLNYREFTALPMVEVFSDIHCVTTWSRYNNLWEGVSTAIIKDLVNIKDEAAYVMVEGENGFTTNLS
jgi:DMSO/TMAO reductase YedYZ molybdopterin-dependent catalytic subunit